MSGPGQTAVIVLAAGRGSRLGDLTSERPKCLVRVGAETILGHILHALEYCAIAKVIVVTGYRSEDVEDSLGRRNGLHIQCVQNPEYMSTGTTASLHRGLLQVAPADDIVIIEGDVIFDPLILQSLLLQSSAGATALAQWHAGLSGSLATIEGGYVTAWLHETRRPRDFPIEQHYKTVNITWFSSTAWREGLLPAVDATLQEDGPAAPVEFAFHRLVTGERYRVRAVPVAERKWIEIDTPEELALAVTLF